MWGAEAGGCWGRAVCRKLLSLSAPNGEKTLQDKKCERSVQLALLGASENLSPSVPQAGPWPREAGSGRQKGEEHEGLSNLSLDTWELLEALQVGVLAVGIPPVSLEEGRGHGPGTEGQRGAAQQPRVGR